MPLLLEFYACLVHGVIKHTVYLTTVTPAPIKNIASQLARSLSARSGPRFSSDCATCLALLTLSAKSP